MTQSTDRNPRHQIFETSELSIEIIPPLSTIYETGYGTYIAISGRCYAFPHIVHSINLITTPAYTSECAYVLKNRYHKNREDIKSESYQFFFAILVKSDEPPIQVSIHVRLRDNRVCVFDIGHITLVERKMVHNQEIADSWIRAYLTNTIHTPDNPPAVICLATYNPDISLFIKQIESIRAQTYQAWICVVNDDCSEPEIFKKIYEIIGTDERFLLLHNEYNLGFYGNFERLLHFIPQETPFIALCDQDDYWYPQKLSRLVSSFDHGINLAFSDMRIVDKSGELLYPSFWTNRKVHYEDLEQQILDNAITGASCMFRGSLLKEILPFPPNTGVIFNNPTVAFHDHWIGCVALAKGRVRFVPEPLHDYYQQGQNSAGYTPQINNTSVIQIIEQVFRKLSRESNRERDNRALNWCFTHGFQISIYFKTLKMRKIPTNQKKIEIIDRLGSDRGILNWSIFLMKKIWDGDDSSNAIKKFFAGKIVSYIFQLKFRRLH